MAIMALGCPWHLCGCLLAPGAAAGPVVVSYAAAMLEVLSEEDDSNSWKQKGFKMVQTMG